MKTVLFITVDEIFLEIVFISHCIVHFQSKKDGHGILRRKIVYIRRTFNNARYMGVTIF